MAPRTFMQFQTQGFQELADEISNLKKAVRSRVLKRAMQEGMKPLRKNGRSTYQSVARIRTGALRQSLGSRRPKRLSGGVWYSIYKPRPEFKAVKSVQRRAAKISVRSRGGGPQPGVVGGNIKPIKYAHLVEFGTVRSRAFPYMDTTFQRSRTQINRGILKGVDSAMDKELSRMEARVNSSRRR